MRPPFAYFGGKTGMASTIVSLFPPHRVYIEPFFGGGAVLFRKQPGPFEIINDLDNAIATFFRVLRDQPEELERVCALTPHSRTEFAAADMTGDLTDVELARRFWVRVNQSFGKTAGRQTGWSITTARTQSVPGSVIGRIARFGALANRLQACSIECCDAADLVTRLATHDTLVYADPPYLAGTRSARAGVNARDYRQDMGSAPDHERLAEVLRATPAKVVLSGYPSPLYDELYGDWWHTDIAVNTHGSSAVTAARGDRVERIWANYEPHAGSLFAPLLEAIESA